MGLKSEGSNNNNMSGKAARVVVRSQPFLTTYFHSPQIGCRQETLGGFIKWVDSDGLSSFLNLPAQQPSLPFNQHGSEHLADTRRQETGTPLLEGRTGASGADIKCSLVEIYSGPAQLTQKGGKQEGVSP